MDRHVGRSVGESKSLMVYGLAAFHRVGFKVLMSLLWCEGVFSCQLR